MTDQEKMIELMSGLGMMASQQMKVQFQQAANVTKMMYDSYIKAGFTQRVALEMTKHMIEVSLHGGKK